MNTPDPTPSDLTFEEAFTQLEAAVARLESAGLSVDELVAEFEAGMGLVKHCQRLLDAAQLRVTVLLREDEGDGVTEDEEIAGEAGNRA